jgi:hypothetical protein
MIVPTLAPDSEKGEFQGCVVDSENAKGKDRRYSNRQLMKSLPTLEMNFSSLLFELPRLK